LNNKAPLADEEIIKRCQQGEKDAYRLLVERYKRMAYAVALAILGSPDDALDASEEAFVKAYYALSSFKPGESFGAWLHRIVVNTAISELRRRKRRKSVYILDLKDELRAKSRSPEEALYSSEVKEKLEEGLSMLDEKKREIIILRDIEGFSYREIAELLKIPLGTVMSRLHEARKELKRVMEKVLRRSK